jgi:hypothetical protein
MENSKILRKYLYSNYYHLFRDKDFQLFISRYGWIRPSIINYTIELHGNILIRKYYTIGIEHLIKDIQFERILCKAGFYGPACTTTSTSTSTTTTT